MTKKNIFLVVLVVASSVLGGAISDWCFRSQPAFAERTAKSSKVITAQSFVLIGKDGNPRATLASSDDGQPYLAFYGSDRRFGMLLQIGKDGTSGLDLFGKGREKPSVSMSAGEDGFSIITIRDDKKSIILSMIPGGAPMMALTDAKYDWPLVMLTEGKDGAPSLDLRDARGQFLVDAHGVDLIDENNHIRITLSLETGRPTLAFLDDSGKPKAALGIDREGRPFRIP